MSDNYLACLPNNHESTNVNQYPLYCPTPVLHQRNITWILCMRFYCYYFLSCTQCHTPLGVPSLPSLQLLSLCSNRHLASRVSLSLSLYRLICIANTVTARNVTSTMSCIYMYTITNYAINSTILYSKHPLAL